MHSLVKLIIVGGLLVGRRGGVRGAPAPIITPAPDVGVLVGRQDPDAVSLAEILLTAIPASLRQIAATDIPAVSSILWEEFLDDNKPEWFLELPQDIQSYLIRKFGPSTAWPTDPPAASSAGESASASATESGSGAPTETSQTGSSGATSPSRTRSGASTASASSTTSAHRSSSQTASSLQTSSSPSSTLYSTSTPSAEPAGVSTLSKNQKIGIGVGVPLALLAVAAFGFGCCTFLRRRKQKNVNGSVPPSSPGFIPRFAFQERSAESLEHRTSLIGAVNRSTQELGHGGLAWDDDGIDPADTAPMQNNHYAIPVDFEHMHNDPYAMNDTGPYSHANAGLAMSDPAPVHHSPLTEMAMHDPKPVMTPVLYHTHSSNRARGKRTSYSSLSSVAEMSEPDETESPILGRHTSANLSSGRNLMSSPPIPVGAQIKRKPVPSSPPLSNSPPKVPSPAAQAASRQLLRQTMPEHSGSSSSGLTLSTSSGFNTSSSSGLNLKAEPTSPVSPISNRVSSNPFNYDTYVEDYGPEYHSGYVDVEDGLYGGHTSLSRYPEPRRKSGRSEWPLRSIVGTGHRRKSSPIWDRIYEE